MILVFNLMEKASGRSWQNLKDDVIPYLERHWSYFWPSGEYPSKNF